MTTYSLLTAAQREHADYLFADAHFGTDPSAYEYELREGEIIGRVHIAVNGDGIHARKPHTVRVNVAVQEVPASYITVEMIRNTEQAITDIARRMVERMSKQLQETPS